HVVVHGSSSRSGIPSTRGRAHPNQWYTSHAHSGGRRARGSCPGPGSSAESVAHRRLARVAVTPAPERPDTTLVRRARKVNRVLAETYPDARCELDFDDPFQLLVVTVLSAQTTDRRVNAARPALFAAYPDPQAMAAAPREHLE